MIMDEVVTYLYNIPRFARTGGLEQTRERLRLLGSPEKRFHYIHVAGTNGKGSVCAFLESCLRNMGFKTGLFTSPHLVRINERIRIDNEEISDEAFIAAFQKVKALIDEQKAQGIPHPTFFEFIFLMGMVAFKEAGIEYGIIETGMGGRLDLTNSVEKTDLSIITSISLDHTEILGDTIAKIAGEKAGIIREETPLIYIDRNPEASEVLAAHKCNSVWPVKPDWMENIHIEPEKLSFTLNSPYFEKYDIRLNIGGSYQIENAALAVTALEVLQKEQHLMNVSTMFREKVLEGMADMRWAGRMEKVADRMYIDGAHNDDGVRQLVRTVNESFKDQGIYLVFAVAEDKDYQHMIADLCRIRNLKGIIVTEINNGRRRDYHDVMHVFEENWQGPIQGTDFIKEALLTGRALQKEEDILLCTGSLYLAGYVKEILGGI